MAVAPNPQQIYDRAEEEGERRLSMSLLEMVSTGFIAGVTIVFGVAALGMAEALIGPALGDGPAKLAGALAFGIGVVFLVVGRSELFTEDFFDPVAKAIDKRTRRTWLLLLRLWGVTLVLNFVGGVIMTLIFSIDGALPADAHQALARVASSSRPEGPSAWSVTVPGWQERAQQARERRRQQVRRVPRPCWRYRPDP